MTYHPKNSFTLKQLVNTKTLKSKKCTMVSLTQPLFFVM